MKRSLLAVSMLLLTLVAVSSQAGERRRSATPSGVAQVEGMVKSVSATAVVITTQSKGDVSVTVNDATVVRKGDTVVSVADLVVGDRVHAQGKLADNVLTATLILVQRTEAEPGDDKGGHDDHANEVEGTISSIAGSRIVVKTVAKGDVTVAADASTVVRKADATAKLSDLKVGDRVHIQGATKDNVFTAALIFVVPAEDAHGTEPGDDKGTKPGDDHGTKPGDDNGGKGGHH